MVKTQKIEMIRSQAPKSAKIVRIYSSKEVEKVQRLNGSGHERTDNS